MNRISTKMKLLSLGLLGLGGIALAGSASAACPSTPDAWSGTFVGGGTSALSIVSGGYDGSSCKMASMLGDSGNARAAVFDNSPSNEPHYRAQFIFDPSALSGTSGNEQAVIFRANAASAYNGRIPLVEMKFGGKGGGGKRLLINVSCDNAPVYVCVLPPITLPAPSGPNRIEFDLVVGAAGTGEFRYWVTDAATATSDTSPTGTLALTGGNQGWVGVDRAYLGLSSPTATYRSVNPAKTAYFDQFDSRRQTFIGH